MKLYTLENKFIGNVYDLPDKFTGIAEYTNGDKEWLVNGKRHREDGPAIEYYDGSKQWFLNGKRHRIGGPVIEWVDGSKHWFIDGEEVTELEHNLLHDLMILKGLVCN